MSISTESVILGIDDAKISPLVADESAVTTYGPAIDVPGITSLKVSPSFVEKDVRGDEHVLDEYSKLDFIDWSFENSMLGLDVLAVLLGGAVALTGVTPNQKQTYSLKNTDKPKYFKLEGQSLYADVGDVHVILYKCKANKVEYTLVGEDYAKVSAGGKAIGTRRDGSIKDIVFNETAISVVPEDAPTALSVTPYPAANATGVATTVELTWTFNNELIPASVNDGTVMVTKADGAVVSGTLSLNAAKKVVTFKPTSALSTGGVYIAIATTGIADMYGQRLSANSVTKFTVA